MPEQVPPNPRSRFIKLLVLTTSAMIIPRKTQIVFQPHVKMPHLHCCIAALSLSWQHNLPVCCFWPAHSETHWLGRFFFKSTTANNCFTSYWSDNRRKKPPRKQRTEQCLSYPLLLQQFVRPALTTVRAGWCIISTVVCHSLGIAQVKTWLALSRS